MNKHANQPPLSRQNPLPLYAQMASLLRERIRQGALKDGEKLPPLEELAANFGVSRVTARQAVQILVSEGFLTSERGRGTLVSAASKEQKWLTVESSWAGLLSSLRGTKPINLETGFVDAAALTHPLAVPPFCAEYRHYRRIWTTDNLGVYAAGEVFLDKRFYQRAPKEFDTTLVLPALIGLAQDEIGEAKQIVRVTLADATIAAHLGVDAGSPVADVTRFFRDTSGVLILFSIHKYNSEYFKLEINLMK